MFEAQNVIRNNLNDRLTKLTNAQSNAYISDHTNPATQNAKLDSQILTVMHLLEIAKSKCEFKTRQIMSIVRQHAGTRSARFCCVGNVMELIKSGSSSGTRV